SVPDGPWAGLRRLHLPGDRGAGADSLQSGFAAHRWGESADPLPGLGATLRGSRAGAAAARSVVPRLRAGPGGAARFGPLPGVAGVLAPAGRGAAARPGVGGGG